MAKTGFNQAHQLRWMELRAVGMEAALALHPLRAETRDRMARANQGKSRLSRIRIPLSQRSTKHRESKADESIPAIYSSPRREFPSDGGKFACRGGGVPPIARFRSAAS